MLRPLGIRWIGSVDGHPRRVVVRAGYGTAKQFEAKAEQINCR